jgi:hypothetical protein
LKESKIKNNGLLLSLFQEMNQKTKILFFFWDIKGDYGINRKEAVSITSGAGTQFVTKIIKILFFFFG